MINPTQNTAPVPVGALESAYTVCLVTNNQTRYFRCDNQGDMTCLRAALVLKFGDLQVSVRRLANHPANHPAASSPGLTDLKRGHKVQHRRATRAARRYLDKSCGV